MQYKMKALAILFISLFVAAPCLFAQENIQAVIRELAGTVEVKSANSEVWVAASRGQILPGDSSISTGFKSTALLALGNSLVTLRPLTRISIIELSKNQSNDKIELKLETGRVRNEVQPPTGGQTEYVIRSPNSTSSVRGTIFELDTLSIVVLQGTVEFSGISGAGGLSETSRVSEAGISSQLEVDTTASQVSSSPVLIDAVGYSLVDEYTGRIKNPIEVLNEELRPAPPLGSDSISVSAPPPTPSGSGPGTPGSPGQSSPGNPVQSFPAPGPIDFTPGIIF